MKKNLLTLGILALAIPASAQSVLMHVDDAATVYISKDALVYNGGGLQTKGSAVIENHGNVMIVGTGTDVFRNLDISGTPVVNGPGGHFINRLNEPANYNQVNAANVIPIPPPVPLPTPVPPVYTYGQIYFEGLSQANITGVVNQEVRQAPHGDYQQMAFPFYDKSVSSLSAELGKTFSTIRYSKNEILSWSNLEVLAKDLPATGLATRMGLGVETTPGFVPGLPPYAYYIVGATGLTLTQTRTLVGRPIASVAVLQLDSAGSMAAAGPNLVPGTFGLGGNNTNIYNETYNSYLQDTFAIPGGVWLGNFGKNIFQYGNPYLTNLDLSKIALEDNIGIGDGNAIDDIYGVRFEPAGVVYSGTTGGGSSTYKYITYTTSGSVVGDIDYTLVRPLGTFVIKLRRNGDATAKLNPATLRRFKYDVRDTSIDYSVSAAKSATAGTVKQLGVIGLDSNGNEVERTYYVVDPSMISGHTINPTVQVANAGGTSFGTFEEDAINGGYDNNNASYWLYINEANENNFKGKNIKLVNYNPNIVSFKFEIRENSGLIPAGQHLLTSGEGFYYKVGGGIATPATQDAVVTSQAGTASGVEYDLYYGAPNTTVLGTSEIKKSRTLVVYNADYNGYFVRFDPNWKKADIQVYDMSGKMVLSKKGIDASRDFKLEIAEDLTVSYIVSITSETGEKVTSKIIKH